MSEPTDTAGPARVNSGQPMSEREAASAAGGYQVNLPTFEGPLDLLLHLISEHKLDILDIPISFVSQKYVEYIMLLQDLNIDLASEYLVMAATLAHIKSKMLLPAPPEGQDDDPAEELDPRAELVRRLLEYQKYKHASEALLTSPVLGRDVFLRGPTAEKAEGEAPLAPVSVFKLLDAFQRLLGRVKQTADHFIDVDRISISERILQIVDQLEGRGPTVFDELMVGEITRADLVVTFLALLEMTRLRMMQILQAGPLSPLYVELTLSDEQQKVLRRDPGDGDPLAALMGGDDEQPGLEASAEPQPDAPE
jgi:segregation and condensation protein A